MEVNQKTAKDFDSFKPTWCPGCGHFGVLKALKQAFVNLNLKPEEIVVVSGIGCSSKLPDYIKTYGFHGIHGRVLPVATGIKLANCKLKVIGTGGDGDGYGIGGNHFIHTSRRNVDITYIVMNNQVYALTKGQVAPTSEHGMVTPSTPFGVKEMPLDGILVALASGASFVARGFAGDIPHLTTLIEKGILHKGFSIIDVLSPCVTFNKINTYQWFREKIVYLDRETPDGYDHREKAFERILKTLRKGQVPVGLFFKEEIPTFEEHLGLQDRSIAFENIENTEVKKEYLEILEDYK